MLDRSSSWGHTTISNYYCSFNWSSVIRYEDSNVEPNVEPSKLPSSSDESVHRSTRVQPNLLNDLLIIMFIPVSCWWIYKIKIKSGGSIWSYKACLFARGFIQEYDIDYEETFAPAARLTSICSLHVVGTVLEYVTKECQNWFFLNGDLPEEVTLNLLQISLIIQINCSNLTRLLMVLNKHREHSLKNIAK